MEEYAHLLRAIADGKKLQRLEEGVWVGMSPIAALSYVASDTVHAKRPERFRIAPAVIDINGRDVPEPLRIPPQKGADYWVAEIDVISVYVRRWYNDVDDRLRMRRGLCHATKEDAQAHVDALLSFTEVEV